MKASDVQHLTEIEIRNLFSIPPENPIPLVSYVDIPSGTKIYTGTANGLYGFDGGGLQFYIDKVQFGGPDSNIPSSWFSDFINITDFLN